jgi:hypothetical protein
MIYIILRIGLNIKSESGQKYGVLNGQLIKVD